MARILFIILMFLIGMIVGIFVNSIVIVNGGGTSISTSKHMVEFKRYTKVNGKWVSDEYLRQWEGLIDTAITRGWPVNKINP